MGYVPQKGWVLSQKVQSGCRVITRVLWGKKRMYMAFVSGLRPVKMGS